MVVERFYRSPGLSRGAHQTTLTKLQEAAGTGTEVALETEHCFYVEVLGENGLEATDLKKVLWIIGTPFKQEVVRRETNLMKSETDFLIEIGPRLNFSTAFSTNAVSICQSIGLSGVTRIERSTRYLVSVKVKGQGSGEPAQDPLEPLLVSLLHDKMTETRYASPVTDFRLHVKAEQVYTVDVMGMGREALERVNRELGLAFDDWDLDFYTEMFREKIKRNPTSVECFDLAQSNSEHSRHWFFKGRMLVDGEEKPDSLFTMVSDTQRHSNQNNVLAFCDNSSAIEGYEVPLLYPSDASRSGAFVRSDVTRHAILTAETHNFPTGVAPFPGATTGTGGRIRDVHATGTGAHVVAGTAGYSFGNLNIPGYDLPWEDKTFTYPPNFASPLTIAVEASNGASDYGNKFGEPVLAGFARSFGMRVAEDDRREYVKPIMFSGGLGSMDSIHSKKDAPEIGMEVVKLGGPIYRIGVGGGSASSVQVQGDNKSELDFGAVQRGDAEMEQKLNRVIRACVEMRENNPIRSIHDQGAGGNGNVLKEIVEPSGAVIRVRDFQLGDPTLSVLEIWGAEYQESDAILVLAKHHDLLNRVCEREKCPVAFVGTVTGDGRIRLDARASENEGSPDKKKSRLDTMDFPVDLDLECVLGKMPRKDFHLSRVAGPDTSPIRVEASVREALDRVLRLPSVASKRYLTNKVDRSVTGLVAQQQCVGPLHTPLADVAVTALSHFSTVGSVTAVGEQPVKGLVDAACGARMTVGEALTNMVFAKVSELKDVKCSANWMWPAKMAGEGALLYDACAAMCDVMNKLGVAVDGGKDSLSMAARVGDKTVKAPGTLVVSTYAPCPDIRLTVTPDFKCPDGAGEVLVVRLSRGQGRMAGSALGQCYNQLGQSVPDLDDPKLFVNAFNVMQTLITDKLITAGHDVSDGGLVTSLLEMAFAGNCGCDVDIRADEHVSPLGVLFAEELSLVLETRKEDADAVLEAFRAADVPCERIGQSLGRVQEPQVRVSVGGTVVVEERMTALRDAWEETSFRLEEYQTSPDCVSEERDGMKARREPPYHYNSTPRQARVDGDRADCPRVAVIREEGSNGDREMVSAFYMAGFQVHDVMMTDLCRGDVTLDDFRGVVFVGGFSYADVFGSAKGWAASCLYNARAREELSRFYAREDTFSLGVCNGCQLMALLGWVAPDETTDKISAGLLLDHNSSERFESRFAAVRVRETGAVMLRGMEGATLGVWVAHGEGRFVFKDEAVEQATKDLICMNYVDDDDQPTNRYPFCPNGSANGVTAICSRDGRHLAMMPHPERTVLPWQWAWMPEEMRVTMETSPWLQMFHNAYDWCMETKK